MIMPCACAVRVTNRRLNTHPMPFERNTSPMFLRNAGVPLGQDAASTSFCCSYRMDESGPKLWMRFIGRAFNARMSCRNGTSSETRRAESMEKARYGIYPKAGRETLGTAEGTYLTSCEPRCPAKNNHVGVPGQFCDE